MATRRVHWHEGMFLRPHHFQLQSQFDLAQEFLAAKWDVHFFWGLRSIELDRAALANYRLVVRSLEARLRDGTLVRVPEDGALPSLDLKPAFARDSRVTISLALPSVRLGQANIGDHARFRVDALALEDENVGGAEQTIAVRLLNLRLLLSTDDAAGYETLPIARVMKAPTPEATPELDETYIPPILACDAWPPVSSQIVEALLDRIGRKIDILAGQITTRSIAIDSQAPGDALIIRQLAELNEAYSVLGLLAHLPGVAPRHLFLELCRLLGKLSIFGPARRPPPSPRYDHDDLGAGFFALKRQIDDLLNVFVEPEYKIRAFVGAGMRMEVALEPAWVTTGWQLFIGVESPLDADAVIRLLTRPGQLDVKIGSGERVDTIFRMGQAGLRFLPVNRPPRVLPAKQGLYYFQVNRDAQELEWQNVQRSLTLAIRLNENLILGNIQGQEVLTIQSGGETTTLRFSLYVAPQEAL